MNAEPHFNLLAETVSMRDQIERLKTLNAFQAKKIRDLQKHYGLLPSEEDKMFDGLDQSEKEYEQKQLIKELVEWAEITLSTGIIPIHKGEELLTKAKAHV